MSSHQSLVNRLHSLHTADLIQLSATHGRRPFFYGMLSQYMYYLAHTWGNILKSIIFLKLNPVDFALAFGCSIVLGIFLILCIILKLPFVQHVFNVWALKNANGLSIVNAFGNIFRKITQVQVDAAKVALSEPPSVPKIQGERIYNLDIAKLLLQFSALMYERGAEPILSALASEKGQKSADHQGPSPSTTLHGLASQGKPLSPAALLADILNGSASEAANGQVNRNVADGTIRDFCKNFGIAYAPVSELNKSDSAYTALFWDPHANWIVVAFKGTSPTEYAEWVSDFTYSLVDARDWLPGFSQGGFLGRIFPDYVSSGGIRPWDTISAGIKLVADHLHNESQDPDAKINVYFTGHSLGCAIASLAYARALLAQKDLGEHVLVRDGYLFAAPIICDVPTVHAFNGAINVDYDMPKTLWRVTNKEDIVATGLPHYGDQQNSFFPKHSLMNFAHLGAEIKMRSKPIPSMVAGWPHITRGLPVFTTSRLPKDLVGTLGINEGMKISALRLERLPLIGRFFQHTTAFYWDQLQRVGVGQCDWL